MHCVVTEDPWFGAYVRVSFGGVYQGGGYTLGPLAQRTLRRETMHTQTSVQRTGSLHEKTCQHHYVEGTVTAASSEPPSGNYLGVRDGGFTVRVGSVEHAVTQTVSSPFEGSGTVRVRATCIQTTYWPGTNNPRLRYEVGMVFRILKTVDRRTGSTVLGSPKVEKSWGPNCVPTIVGTANPFGSAYDGLSRSFDQISYWVDTLFGSKPQAIHNGLRDAAILEALSNCSVVDVNPLTDATDALVPTEIIRGLGNSIEPHSLLGVARTVANLHLFWKYVVQTNLLTASQVERLRMWLSRQRQECSNVLSHIVSSDVVGHGSATESWVEGDVSYSLEYTAKVVLSPGWGPFAALGQAQLLGLAPDVADVWDMIPYSFVVDWLLPVQRTLQDVSNIASLTMMPIRYILFGSKLRKGVSQTFVSGIHRFRGDLDEVTYSRSLYPSLPSSMRYRSFSPSGLKKHWVTGLALLAQR